MGISSFWQETDNVAANSNMAADNDGLHNLIIYGTYFPSNILPYRRQI